jgi:hypothetical protein
VSYETVIDQGTSYLLPFENTGLQLVDQDCLMLGCMVFAVLPCLDSKVGNFLHILVLLKASKQA